MKKIRVLFATAAVLLAVGGAFSTTFFVNTYYELRVIDIFTPPQIRCDPHTVSYFCTTAMWSTPCQSISGVHLRRDNHPPTQCGPLMYRQEF